jgi:hypothetical protein
MLIVNFAPLNAKQFSFRKYQHVKKFYKDITPKAIEICLKHDLPPAAVLAVAGLESGYGRGYVAQITGNILSLGAFKGDKELPRLYLPYSKSKKMILFDPNEIKKHKKSDLSWKKREKSYKRDYRPAPYAGTTKNLELLMYDSTLRDLAHSACLNDFATRWIQKRSKVKAFRDAKVWIEKQIDKKDKQILFSMNTNKEFIGKIGGRANSFNYRKTWPKKVKLIMKKVGLVELIDDIYNKKMSFEEAWGR